MKMSNVLLINGTIVHLFISLLFLIHRIDDGMTVMKATEKFFIAFTIGFAFNYILVLIVRRFETKEK